MSPEHLDPSPPRTPREETRLESPVPASPEALEEAKRAFHADDAAALRRVLERHPALKSLINEPVAGFDSPLVTCVQSSAMLDALLDAGADINARSRWWAGGFGLLDRAEPDLAAHAIRRGAVVTVHAAARLGMLPELEAMVAADPALVHARGGDGQRPLHFAATVPIAEFLLDRGADIDALDVDHESTPAMYMVRGRPDVARSLIRRGCRTDLLMAAALGDLALARKLLDRDPEAIRLRVSDESFPMIGSGAGGGTIYQWELGWHVSAVQVARSFGHAALGDFLMARCPLEEKLLNACWLHDEAMVETLLAQDRGLAARLPAPGRRQLAHAARNNDAIAARLLLDAGLPVEAYSQHHATALHWAAWHGNAELVGRILRRAPPLEDADNDFKGTPLGWALHGSENGWHRQRGDYPAAVEALLDAGAKLPARAGGTEAVREVLCRRGLQ